MTPALDFSIPDGRAALKRVGAVTLAGAALGALYGLLAPKWYQAELSVVPAKPQRAGISSMLGAELGGLVGGIDPSLGVSADASRIAAVLRSNSVTDAVIGKFDLRTRYGERSQERARDTLWRHCDVNVLPKPNLVKLTCEDKDPRFLQEMLAYFAEHGNQVFRRVGVSSATEEVRFLEARVTDLRRQADEAAARLRAFQEQHHVVDLDSQARAVVAAMAGLNSQSIAKQLELDYARTFSSHDEDATRQLQAQLSVVDQKLQELQGSREGSGGPGEKRKAGRRDPSQGLFPAALAVPGLRAEYEGLYRDRKVTEATLIYALERLEGAKAAEARDVSTFLVLDAPTVPTRHVRPKRLTILAVFTMLGLAVAVSLEWWIRRGPLATGPGTSTSLPHAGAETEREHGSRGG